MIEDWISIYTIFLLKKAMVETQAHFEVTDNHCNISPSKEIK
jgi:hypothetical protein